MKTSDLSRIATSSPIDRTAKNVTAQHAISHYRPEPTSPYHGSMPRWYEECPPLIPIPKSQLGQLGFVDYTGRTVGRMKVIGWGGLVPGRKAPWICRCACGRYEFRKSAALKNGCLSVDGDHCCTVCNNTRRVREGRGNSYLEVRP